MGLRKTDTARMDTVLYVLVEINPAIWRSCASPHAGGDGPDAGAFGHCGGSGPRICRAGDAIAPGTALPPPVGIFPRYVDPAEAGKGAPAPKKLAKGQAS